MRHFIAAIALMISTSVLAVGDLPTDVQNFVDTREGCDHFRGEPWDLGDETEVRERREFNFKKVKELCRGTDSRLAALRHRYRNKPLVIERLRQFEDVIETQP